MSTGAYNENAYENAVLEVLRSMKWEYMYGPDIERDYSDPTLPDVFEYQVRKLNKGVPDEAVNDAIRQVRGIAGGSVVVRNAIFTDWLQNGVDGACRVAGDDTTRLVQLVDYAHPEKNAFHAVNQWTVQNGEVVKRPDVVLFVNGLPLVVIELKNPSKPETTVHEAFLQLRRNRTVDWEWRESARSQMKMLVKRLLRKYKYPPDEATGALETVMRQCELWVDETAGEYDGKAESALPHQRQMWQGRPRSCWDPYEYAEAATKGDSKENADDGYETV